MDAVPEAGRARRRAALIATASALTFLSPSALARTGTCKPVRVASSVEGPWRAALEALSRATAQEGLPWSCPGGAVDLTPDAASARDGSPAGATLSVTDATGRSISRHVAGPDEVVPTGQALLATPLEETAAPAPLPVQAPPPDQPPASASPPHPTEPRAQIHLAIGPRFSGPGTTGWGSARLGLQLPIGPWSVGFWARYDVPLSSPPGNWLNLDLSAVSAGLSAGRRIISKPFELRATLDPSIAVVMMEAGHENTTHPEGAKPVFRLGSSVSGLFPIAGVFRGVVAVEGEFAPAGITGLRNIDTHNQPPQLPPVPVYTAGILLGVEASIR